MPSPITPELVDRFHFQVSTIRFR